MIKTFKKEKILVFVLIFAGLLSLLINLAINYEISLSQKNKKAYETIEKLSKYPKPLLIFANKNFETLNETDLIETQTWLDENNSSQSNVEIINGNLNVSVKFNSNFQLSKYLNKVLSLTNVNIKKINIKFNTNQIHLILGESNSL
mgnify:CR=1 FL=1